MLVLRGFLHTGAQGALSKSNLAKLRKRTGFSFVNCKKALQKFDQDLSKAEAWLQEQAQKEGWTKATKLKDRATSEGLIGLVYDNHNCAAMVEVNCETDFVARNETFQNFVRQVAAATLHHYRKGYGEISEPVKLPISKSDLSNLQVDGGKSLEDLTALTIGQVKENMALRRALCMFLPAGYHLGYYVHSPVATSKQDKTFCMMGRYTSLVALQQDGDTVGKQFNPKEFGRMLCQHIVGMNPLTIGEYTRPPPQAEPETQESAEPIQESTQGFSDSEEDQPPPEEEVIPTEMLMQDYLLNTSVCVGEHLLQHNVSLVDFARYEVGETVEGES